MAVDHWRNDRSSDHGGHSEENERSGQTLNRCGVVCGQTFAERWRKKKHGPNWRIPRVGEPGGLPSMGLHRVRHD